MPTYLTPGVYVEEVPSASKPIEGVGTSIAAFVGLAPDGPINTPMRVSSWPQFTRLYTDPAQPDAGPYVSGGYLAHAVHGFFQNGGSTCWIVRVGKGQNGAGTGQSERKPVTLSDGVAALADIGSISIVCVPDIAASSEELADVSSDEVVHALRVACEAVGNRVAILDAPPDLSPEDLLEWRANVAGDESESVALYYPWLEVVDPLSDQPILVPPSGHVAGVWARTASTWGVHRAPADAMVLGVSSLSFEVGDEDQERLDRAGVNTIRAFSLRGIRVWGARTLSSDPEWRYVNVRRTFIYLAESLEKGTQWAVFEPNDEELWSRLRSSISAFLTRAWSEGALCGASPEDAFYVKCDEETNPPEVVEAGQVVVEVGIAPLRPAEFVVFDIRQITARAFAADIRDASTKARWPTTVRRPVRARS
jgi:phage tail sheath protein FI